MQQTIFQAVGQKVKKSMKRERINGGWCRMAGWVKEKKSKRKEEGKELGQDRQEDGKEKENWQEKSEFNGPSDWYRSINNGLISASVKIRSPKSTSSPWFAVVMTHTFCTSIVGVPCAGMQEGYPYFLHFFIPCASSLFASGNTSGKTRTGMWERNGERKRRRTKRNWVGRWAFLRG